MTKELTVTLLPYELLISVNNSDICGLLMYSVFKVIKIGGRNTMWTTK